jgi:hypothetical protein
MQDQAKPNISRRKEIIKIRAEINEVETAPCPKKCNGIMEQRVFMTLQCIHVRYFDHNKSLYCPSFPFS